MATLQERNGSFRILFLYHGKRETFSLGKVPREIAEAKSAKVDEVLALLRNGYIAIPPATDIVTFLKFDGKPPEKSASVPASVPTTLVSLRDRYLETHRHGSLEESTLGGMEIHFNHLVATLGEKFPVEQLSLADLQKHVDRRRQMRGQGGKLSPATIRKEIVTLRTAWNWGVPMGLVAGRFLSMKQLTFPKPEEKPPFMTWQEIENRIASGRLTQKQKDELWDSLYLTRPEIAELLDHVHKQASQPWVYPIFCTAAHTGARRSELLRMEVHDVDLAGDTVLIRERKRSHEKKTTRRVALTPFLKEVLRDWLVVRPQCSNLFCQGSKVVRSKTRRSAPTPVTRDEAHDHFKRTLAGSKWEVLKGYHTLRHSFISCMAAAGIDQRIIDEFVGHQTEEQRRRYRHLTPDVKREAIRSVFGG